MVWFLIVLIVVGIVFVIWVVGDYNSKLTEFQDIIRDLKQQTRLLEYKVSRDEEAIGQKRVLLKDLNLTVNDMKQEVFAIDTKLKVAQKEENDLEMRKHKQDFRKSKQRDY